MQHTLKSAVTISDIGLHSNNIVNVTIKPAPTNTGVVFTRVDIKDKENSILARWDKVVDTRLCTVIGNEAGVTVSTIEHLMAALRGCGIDNALVEIDAGEVPILDGSAQPFVKLFDEAGTIAQSAPRRAIKVKKEIRYVDGDREVILSPSNVPVYSGQIDYHHKIIGSQRYEMKLVNGNFKHDLADCRTFCLLSDVEMMQANGLALGGSLDNAVVVNDEGVMNAEGLRCENEFIRHKLLDAVGDLSLCGGLFLGHYEGIKIGHAMNNRALHALFADDEAWEVVDLFVEVDEADIVTYPKAVQKSATQAAL